MDSSSARGVPRVAEECAAASAKACRERHDATTDPRQDQAGLLRSANRTRVELVEFARLWFRFRLRRRLKSASMATHLASIKGPDECCVGLYTAHQVMMVCPKSQTPALPSQIPPSCSIRSCGHMKRGPRVRGKPSAYLSGISWRDVALHPQLGAVKLYKYPGGRCQICLLCTVSIRIDLASTLRYTISCGRESHVSWP